MIEPVVSKPVAPESLTQDWAGHTLDMLGALLLVVAAVFLVSLVVRHIQQRSGGNGRHLHIIQALSLGTKDRVLLVQVGVDQILMGVSSAGISHIHTLTEAVDHAEPDATREKPAHSVFAKTIQTIESKQ